MRKNKLAFVLLSALAAATIYDMPASASLTHNIDLEGASINGWDIVDSGITYKEKNLDRNLMYAPYLSTWTPSGTGSSIKYEAQPSTVSGGKQRTEHYVVKKEPFNQWRYVGFHIGLPADAVVPSDWVVLSQFHQNGYYVSPTGALELVNSGGSFRFVFKIRNKDYYLIDNQTGPSGNALSVWSQNFTKGQFNRIVIGFKPDTGGNGQVKIWYNGTLATDWTGYLGFANNFLGKPFVSDYYNSFGIYRAAQNNTLKVYYDNYKWGTTYNDVAN
jgi:hypothetical protein